MSSVFWDASECPLTMIGRYPDQKILAISRRMEKQQLG